MTNDKILKLVDEKEIFKGMDGFVCETIVHRECWGNGNGGRKRTVLKEFNDGKVTCVFWVVGLNKKQQRFTVGKMFGSSGDPIRMFDFTEGSNLRFCD